MKAEINGTCTITSWLSDFNRVRAESLIFWKILNFAKQSSRPWKSLECFFKATTIAYNKWIHSLRQNRQFGNLESANINYCFGIKGGKSLEFWIQKSVRTLFWVPGELALILLTTWLAGLDRAKLDVYQFQSCLFIVVIVISILLKPILWQISTYSQSLVIIL